MLYSKTVGFKLEALEKLRQIKSNSGESIEQYVAHQVRVLVMIILSISIIKILKMFIWLWIVDPQ